MSDVVDQAQDHIERETNAQIAHARAVTNTLPFTGECHWCSEEVEAPKRFCDRDCADDHARAARQRKALGL